MPESTDALAARRAWELYQKAENQRLLGTTNRTAFRNITRAAYRAEVLEELLILLDYQAARNAEAQKEGISLPLATLLKKELSDWDKLHGMLGIRALMGQLARLQRVASVEPTAYREARR